MDWLEKLKEMKSACKITTREISFKSGIPEPTLEKLFAGQTKDPKLSTIQAVVHSLGFTLDDLDAVVDTKKSSDSGEPGAEEDFQNRVNIITDFCIRMGYLEPNGDISKETLHRLMALIDFLDSWFLKTGM